MTNKLIRMMISANGNIGVGTNEPSDLFELDAGNARKGLTITSQGDFSDSDAFGSSLEFYAINVGRGYYALLSFKSNGDVVMVSGKCDNRECRYWNHSAPGKLSVNDNVRAKEVKVEKCKLAGIMFYLERAC